MNWILNLSGKQSESHTPLLVFDTLSPLMSGNDCVLLMWTAANVTYNYVLSLEFIFRGHCRWCNTPHSFLVLLSPRPRPTIPLLPLFSTCLPPSTLPAPHACSSHSVSLSPSLPFSLPLAPIRPSFIFGKDVEHPLVLDSMLLTIFHDFLPPLLLSLSLPSRSFFPQGW